MKAHYEQYRAHRKGSDLRTFRLPTMLYSQIERLAEIEDDSVTSLVIEGLARVLEDRLSPENVAASIAALRQQTESQVTAMQQLAHERIAAMQEMAAQLRSQDE